MYACRVKSMDDLFCDMFHHVLMATAVSKPYMTHSSSSLSSLVPSDVQIGLAAAHHVRLYRCRGVLTGC